MPRNARTTAIPQALSDTVSKIASLMEHRDVDLLEISLLKTVAELAGSDWGAIFHADPDADDDADMEFSVAFRDGQLIHENFPESWAELRANPDIAAFPIFNHDHKVLAYMLVHRTPPLSESEQNLLGDLLHIYDNFIGVLRDSQIDRLTGLLNRYTFDAQLERALTLIRHTYVDLATDQTNRSVSDGHGRFFLAELDIDHFKKINDVYGHLYGDEVLIMVARILQRSFRKTDLVYRFGGEEFVVIVLVDDKPDAEVTFERLRQSIEQYDFPQVGRVTVSIGVTEIHDSSVPVELLGRADQALYYAKKHGRNRVCFYEALVENHSIDVPHTASDLTLF